MRLTARALAGQVAGTKPPRETVMQEGVASGKKQPVVQPQKDAYKKKWR